MSEIMVKVCSVCRKASCIHGILCCGDYETADIIELPLSLLHSLAYEDEQHWDDEYWKKFKPNERSRVPPPPRVYTEHELSVHRLARHISEAIYARLSAMKSDLPVWHHDPHQFLPANVCCDYAGKMGFINTMAYEAQKVIDLETYELVMPKTKEELDKCLQK